MALHDTIRLLIERDPEKSVNALAKKMGLNQPTLHRLISGESHDPKRTTLEKVAKYFRCTVDDLHSGACLNQTPRAEEKVVPYSTIPETGTEAALKGTKTRVYAQHITPATLHDYPVITTDEIMQGIEPDRDNPEFMAGRRTAACSTPAGQHDFAFIAEDDAMNGGPRPIPRGSTVFISRDAKPVSGSVVWVRINNARPILRTLITDGDEIQLQPQAPGLHARRIGRDDSYEVLGIVIESTLSHRVG